jgi:hypothetical protein
MFAQDHSDLLINCTGLVIEEYVLRLELSVTAGLVDHQRVVTGSALI